MSSLRLADPPQSLMSLERGRTCVVSKEETSQNPTSAVTTAEINEADLFLPLSDQNKEFINNLEDCLM